MDDKIRDLALLAAASLFCAALALTEGRLVFGSVFSAFGIAAILAAGEKHGRGR
jgi:hypothetical protein